MSGKVRTVYCPLSRGRASDGERKYAKNIFSIILIITIDFLNHIYFLCKFYSGAIEIFHAKNIIPLDGIVTDQD